MSEVENNITATDAKDEATYYTVKSGDTLSAISKTVYGDASQYNKIFEANRPMLSSPDKIYPGRRCVFLKPDSNGTRTDEDSLPWLGFVNLEVRPAACRR